MDDSQFQNMSYADKMKKIKELQAQDAQQKQFRENAFKDMGQSVTDPSKNIQQKQQNGDSTPAEDIQKKLIDFLGVGAQNQALPAPSNPGSVPPVSQDDTQIKMAALQKIKDMQDKDDEDKYLG